MGIADIRISNVGRYYTYTHESRQAGVKPLSEITEDDLEVAGWFLGRERAVELSRTGVWRSYQKWYDACPDEDRYRYRWVDYYDPVFLVECVVHCKKILKWIYKGELKTRRELQALGLKTRMSRESFLMLQIYRRGRSPLDDGHWIDLPRYWADRGQIKPYGVLRFSTAAGAEGVADLWRSTVPEWCYLVCAVDDHWQIMIHDRDGYDIGWLQDGQVLLF